MNNLKFDNVNVEYGFTFKVHLQSIKIAIMTSQIVPLIVFSPWYGKLLNVKTLVHNNKISCK
jgi:hypothetical protein